MNDIITYGGGIQSTAIAALIVALDVAHTLARRMWRQ